MRKILTPSDVSRFEDTNTRDNLQPKQESEVNKGIVISQDNHRLKALKESKKNKNGKYRIVKKYGNKTTLETTAMAICDLGFLPLGQLYNGDYKTALTFGLINIAHIVLIPVWPNSRRSSEGYSTNFVVLLGVWQFTWIAEILQAFISASMEKE